jgi:hypothetical protein
MTLIWETESERGTTLRLYTPEEYMEEPFYRLTVGEDDDLQAIFNLYPDAIGGLLHALRNVNNGGAW